MPAHKSLGCLVLVCLDYTDYYVCCLGISGYVFTSGSFLLSLCTLFL